MFLRFPSYSIFSVPLLSFAIILSVCERLVGVLRIGSRIRTPISSFPVPVHADYTKAWMNEEAPMHSSAHIYGRRQRAAEKF